MHPINFLRYGDSFWSKRLHDRYGIPLAVFLAGAIPAAAILAAFLR